ncbi:MAG TPA: hypothetical protein DGT23_21775 [Micromonosporaceae bacterium]|nr:hypothetical protein [Micromonosporaceae bacterium]
MQAAARNTWTVTALSDSQCRVDIAAEFTTRGILGRIVRAVILARVLRDGRQLLDDLKHFTETGTPSPRKQSRTSQTRCVLTVRPAMSRTGRQLRPYGESADQAHQQEECHHEIPDHDEPVIG